jgi:hypothetical protein
LKAGKLCKLLKGCSAVEELKDLFISKNQEREYLRIPFEVGEGVESVEVECFYLSARSRSVGSDKYFYDLSAIDLAIAGPNGDFIGSAGSNRKKIRISPLGSSPGFDSRHISSGTWEIIVGAYQIPDAGARISYKITLNGKSRRLFKGDTHIHTIASDGLKSTEEIIFEAKGLGLDFIILTDHNNYAQNLTKPQDIGITIISGTEWTHYKGHAGFLGAAKPFSSLYCVQDLSGARKIFEEARRSGAFTVLNHPFCHLVPWEWGFDVPFDGLEIWNGVMSERNMKAIHWWHSRLAAGYRIPATGGSDYHRTELLGGLATPTMCLYAPSREPCDLLASLRKGSGFISYIPNGPSTDALSRERSASFGDEAGKGEEIDFTFTNISGSDEIRFITDSGSENIICEEGASVLVRTRSFGAAKFVRLEVWRSYAIGLPPMLALASNPIYLR